MVRHEWTPGHAQRPHGRTWRAPRLSTDGPLHALRRRAILGTMALLTLANWNTPPGRSDVFVAVITVGNDAADDRSLYHDAQNVGSLDLGDTNVTADYRFDRIRMRTLGAWVTIQDADPRSVDAQTLFEAGGDFEDGIIYVQNDAGTMAGVSMADIGAANIGGGGLNIRDTVTGGPALLAILDALTDGDCIILAFTLPAIPPAYAQGLAVSIGSVATKPLTGSLDLSRSLADGSTLRFNVQASRSSLAHVTRGVAATVTDVESSTLIFSGNVLRAVITSIGPGDLVNIDVEATGLEQRLYRRILSAENARAVNLLAASASDQLDELADIAGPDFTAGATPDDVNALAGVGPGATVGALLRGMGDAQGVNPDGTMDLIIRAGLVAATDVTLDHVRPTSRYRVDLDTAVGRVIANGAPVKFIASGTLENVTEGGVTIAVASVGTPSDTEVQTVERVIARAAITNKFAAGDELDGVWDPDKNRFEWSGVLGAGDSAIIELHGVWRTELIVSAPSPSALARDLTLDVPVTSTTAITAAANRALAQQRHPIELMNLDVVLGAELPRLVPGDAVTVALTLQEDLDVYQPEATDLWLVHGVRLAQVAANRINVRLLLSRRLPDYRERDYWGAQRRTTDRGDGKSSWGQPWDWLAALRKSPR